MGEEIMAQLPSESDEQFLTRIKTEFKDANVDLILIDGGDTFVGSFEQLDDCFGIYPDQLDSWCEAIESTYEVIKNAS